MGEREVMELAWMGFWLGLCIGCGIGFGGLCIGLGVESGLRGFNGSWRDK